MRYTIYCGSQHHDDAVSKLPEGAAILLDRKRDLIIESSLTWGDVRDALKPHMVGQLDPNHEISKISSAG